MLSSLLVVKSNNIKALTFKYLSSSVQFRKADDELPIKVTYIPK